MDFTFDYNSLSERFSKIRNELDETIVSLEKLNRYGNFDPSGCNRQVFMPIERNVSSEETSTKNGEQDQFTTASESEESGADNDHDHPSKKVALQSAVITKIGSSKTRKKFIRSYNLDNKVQLRNRRFLGMVQSTLQKFQDEEVRRQPQDLKRKIALERVEAAAEEEKKSVKKQKAELFYKSRKQRMELECLEKMMRIAESFELWENNQRYLLNYVATKTEPRIFFLPKRHSPATKKELERTTMEIIERIERQKTFVKGILSRIRESYDLSMPVSTEETSPISEVDTTQCVLKPENACDEAKEGDEILHLDLSDSEAEDFD